MTPPDGGSFSNLTLGEEMRYSLPPYGYWNLHLTLKENAELRLALTIPRGISLGLYARKDVLPTHTQYDLMEILIGRKERQSRSTQSMVDVVVEKVLEAGYWFLCLYNDDGESHEVVLVATRGPGAGECPSDCQGQGQCILGRCQCEPGYGGNDCSQMLCPILCSGHGDYVAGQCQCHPGWKGQECQLRHHECELPECSGHGHCVEGQCRCAKGFTGDFCEIATPAHFIDSALADGRQP